MKTCIPKPTPSRRGYALVMVLIITAVTFITLAAIMSRTSSTSLMNERTNQRLVSQHAAEAATEKVLAHMAADYAIDAEASVMRREASYRTLLPAPQELAAWGDFEFYDAQGTPGRVSVERLSASKYVALDSQYAGLYGFASTYRIAATARQLNAHVSVPAAVQQEVQLAEIPVFQFAIFYNGLLEFTRAVTMTIKGRVHANQDIYVGSAFDLTFEAPVSTAGNVVKKGWAGWDLSKFTGKITYRDSKAEDAPSLTLPIGTENTPDAVRQILYPPPPGEPMYSEMGMQRLYHKAELLVLVENNGLSVQVKNPYDPLPTTIPPEQAAAFLSTTPQFTDQREGKVVSVTEIDVAKLGTWASTNAQVAAKLGAGQPPTVLYVADNRTHKAVTAKTSTGTQTVTVPVELAAVRLVNGRKLPTSGKTGIVKGLSVATPNPLYVKGDYNDPLNIPAGSNDSAATEPAALFSDALTILSQSWDDNKSASSYTTRKAVETTVNAAIVTGAVDTRGASGNSPFSGGVHNLPRLLEDWGTGSVKLTLNTSIVNLFNSAKATAPFQDPGVYYKAPARFFNFDRNFTDPSKLPPGTPRLRAIIRSNWTLPSPSYASK